MVDALCLANRDESGAGGRIGETGIEHSVRRQRMSGEPRDPIAPGGIIGNARRGKRFTKEYVEVATVHPIIA